jgi:uncharacterized membrane protein
MRKLYVGHVVFALVMVGLGVMGLVSGHFAPIWDGVPKGMPAREGLAYLCALVSLACGLGLLWKHTAASAARTLFAYLLLWMLLFKLPFILRDPLVEVSYQSCGETAVLVAAAWVLYAGLAPNWDRRQIGFATGDKGVRGARVLYGLAMIAFGLSHFAYMELTAPLVPGWLPWHTAWAYLTGSAYLAAGVAVIVGVLARLAAALSALQMGLFALLVWVPLAFAGKMSAFNWGELVVTCALTAGGWVVADSYRSVPWLASGKAARG